MAEQTSPDLVAIIMAGGAGTRLWPASTSARPKQFLAIGGDRSLLQQSYDRLVGLIPDEKIFVLTSAAFVGLCREQLPELPTDNVLGEPMRRDTAAAIAWATAVVEARFDNPVMAVLTSDHVIRPPEDFQACLRSAATQAAAHDALYTFGIPPTYAATGFGYLDLGESTASEDAIEHHRLQRFVEKPDAETAAGYVDAKLDDGNGRYLWNSGMFVWQTKVIADQLDTHLPAHLATLRPSVGKGDDATADAFEKLEKISIDYAVLEKAPDVRCVRATFSWDDVGSFEALPALIDVDDAKNAHRGGLVAQSAGGNIVYCQDEAETVALLGVDNLVVVRAGKKTLIMPRSRGQDLKALVADLPDELQ